MDDLKSRTYELYENKIEFIDNDTPIERYVDCRYAVIDFKVGDHGTSMFSPIAH
jgi:hypothetical protein